MKIQEFKDYKDNFESELHDHIQAELDKFKKETGIKLTELSISTDYLKNLGDHRIIVFKVKTRTELN